jgi:hypothetical protein
MRELKSATRSYRVTKPASGCFERTERKESGEVAFSDRKKAKVSIRDRL